MDVKTTPIKSASSAPVPRGSRRPRLSPSAALRSNAAARSATDARIGEARGAGLSRQIDVAEIDENVSLHAPLERIQVERTELVPFGDHHGHVGRFRRGKRALAPLDAR